MKEKLEFTQVVGERCRTYHMRHGKYNKIKVHNVIAICVRPSGGHRLETKDGIKLIVPPTWNAIEIDADDWSC